MTVRIKLKNEEGENGDFVVIDIEGGESVCLYPGAETVVYVHDFRCVAVRKNKRKRDRRPSRIDRRKSV